MGDGKMDNQDDFVVHGKNGDDETEELARNDSYESATSVFRKKSVLPYVIGGAGVIFLVVFLIVLLSGPRNAVTEDQLQSLETRIQTLENRLAKIDEIDQHLARLEQQEKESGLLIARFNQFESAVATQIDQIIKELGTSHQRNAQEPLTRTTPPQPVEKAAPQPPDKVIPQKETPPKFHQVRTGETLYGISRTYGLTVDQLRQYNHIGAKEAIHPGQKLKLTPNAAN